MEKEKLRTKAKNIRKTLDMKTLSQNLTAKLREQEFYKSAKNVMIFYPLENEIDVLGLLEDDKNFFLPRVNSSDLLVCPYKKGDRLEKSKFNVNEPCVGAVGAEILDLIIVPALMTDENNHRLGYGGGFYDRFLASFPDIKSVVLIPKALTIPCLPAEPCDVPAGCVIAACEQRAQLVRRRDGGGEKSVGPFNASKQESL